MGHILSELYFVTTTVVDWVDIFTRPRYKHIVIDSLTYCQRERKSLYLRLQSLVSKPKDSSFNLSQKKCTGFLPVSF